MDTRMYYVRNKDKIDDKGRLVEASHPAQAFRHVARELLEVSLPTALEVARLMAAGVKPENANGPVEPTIDPNAGDPF